MGTKKAKAKTKPARECKWCGAKGDAKHSKACPHATMAKVRAAKSKPNKVLPKKPDTRTARERLKAGETVSLEDLVNDTPRKAKPSRSKRAPKGPIAPGTPVLVAWPGAANGMPHRRGILRGYTREGRPVVNMARVNARGEYTGEIAEGKGRTFEVHEVTPIDQVEVMVEVVAAAEDAPTPPPPWPKNPNDMDVDANGDIVPTVDVPREPAPGFTGKPSMDTPDTVQTTADVLNGLSATMGAAEPSDAGPAKERYDRTMATIDKAIDKAKEKTAAKVAVVDATTAACRKCGSAMMATRSGKQRVCTRCADYFEKLIAGEWVAYGGEPKTVPTVLEEKAAPAAAAPQMTDDFLPPLEDDIDDERAPWE